MFGLSQNQSISQYKYGISWRRREEKDHRIRKRYGRMLGKKWKRKNLWQYGKKEIKSYKIKKINNLIIIRP